MILWYLINILTNFSMPHKKNSRRYCVQVGHNAK